jgi:hypothetical protein
VTTTRTTSSKTPQTRKATTRTAASRTAAPRSTASTKRASAPQGESRSPAKPVRKSTAEVDSPILPVDQLDALRKIKPGAVDWIIEQTQVESEHRRAEQVRVNNLIFVEHLFAQASALIVGVTGVGGGVWLAERGQPWVGVAIAAVVMVALAVVQVSMRKNR